MLVFWFFLWRVIWISLLIDVLEENVIHSIETMFGDYKICNSMDDKVPCHRACATELTLYSVICIITRYMRRNPVVSPVPLNLAA